MSKVRKGIAQASSNEESYNIIVWEVIVVSAGVGLYTRSIAWGAGTFILFSAALFAPYVRKILYTAMSIIWGSVAVIIIDLFTDSLLPPGKSPSDLGVFGLLESFFSNPDLWIPFIIVAMGVFWGHLEAHEHVKDVTDSDERSL